MVYIICNLIKKSNQGRKIILNDCDGPEVFVNVIGEKGFSAKIIKTLTLWMEEDPESIDI